MSKLYFFRHAQASFMSDNYDKLSGHGEKQSEELGKYLVKKGFHFDKIFVGPLERQKKTFEIVAGVFSKNKMMVPEPVIIEELREHSGPRAMRYVFPKLRENNSEVEKLLQIAEKDPRLKKRNHFLYGTPHSCRIHHTTHRNAYSTNIRSTAGQSPLPNIMPCATGSTKLAGNSSTISTKPMSGTTPLLFTRVTTDGFKVQTPGAMLHDRNKPPTKAASARRSCSHGQLK